jgi:hypothetical protein
MACGVSVFESWGCTPAEAVQGLCAHIKLLHGAVCRVVYSRFRGVGSRPALCAPLLTAGAAAL